ncbi:tetraacyldisaccharide 4'-kinase [bacterium]|nr:tetraacyldisaccharide 4'-kinase [bacterium]
MMQKMKLLLLPLALPWGLFAIAKRFMYHSGIKKRYQSKLKTMVVGNLSMGGSGKTPFAMYLIQKLLARNENVAYLSRGYGRSTKGLQKVSPQSTATQVGDEALMVKKRFPQVDVVVCENRKEGLQFLEKSSICSVVVLDDAFQHLRIAADFYYLLSPYQAPFWRDWVFPSGYLREPAYMARYAHAVVLTKSPQGLAAQDYAVFNAQQKKYSHRDADFVGLDYGSELISVYGNENLPVASVSTALAFTGIASAQLFFKKVEETLQLKEKMEFADHHNFSEKEIEAIVMRYQKLAEKVPDAVLLTTEKDAARLQTQQAKKLLMHLPLYYWPIQLATTHEFNSKTDKIIDQLCLNK